MNTHLSSDPISYGVTGSSPRWLGTLIVTYGFGEWVWLLITLQLPGFKTQQRTNEGIQRVNNVVHPSSAAH